MKSESVLISIVLIWAAVISSCAAEKAEDSVSWIKVSEVDRVIQEKNPQIVDIRTPAEYRGGFLKGAVNLPLSDLESGVSSLDNKRPVLIYCNTVNRVRASLPVFKKAGFTKIYIIDGGYSALKRAGYPLVSP